MQSKNGATPLPKGHEIMVSSLGPLTIREAEALLWIAEGKTSWEAGAILGVTECTHNSHIATATTKLKASNRTHLVARAFVLGILARNVIVAVLILQISLNGTDAARRWRPRTARKRDEYAFITGRI